MSVTARLTLSRNAWRLAVRLTGAPRVTFGRSPAEARPSSRHRRGAGLVLALVLSAMIWAAIAALLF